MYEKWIAIHPTDVCMVLISAIFTYVGVLIYTRIVGLRSFSKMSAADFAMTIAVGSMFGATVSSPSPTLMIGLFAIACLFAGQWFLAKLRSKSNLFCSLIDNNPLLLMIGSEILEGNLRKANMTKLDLYGKLRAANVLNFNQIHAVVFETTGDVSVMHGDQQERLDHEIFSGVEGLDRLKCNSPLNEI